MTRRRWMAIGTLVGLAIIGCGGEKLQPAKELEGLVTIQAPAEWKTVNPDSPLRLAQYELSRYKTDKEDATLLVYFFKKDEGGGGDVEGNLERWYGQFQQPDGGSTKERAKVTKRTVSGMPVTLADMSGTYTATAMTPMMMHGQPAKPKHRMLAAIVELPTGSFFFKLAGPENTVEEWKRSFERFIDRIRKK